MTSLDFRPNKLQTSSVERTEKTVRHSRPRERLKEAERVGNPRRDGNEA